MQMIYCPCVSFVFKLAATPGSPERAAIMRAGLQALLRAEATNQPISTPVTSSAAGADPIRNPVTNIPGVWPSSQPMREQNRKPVMKRRPLPSGRSLLLPAKLKVLYSVDLDV